MKDPTKILKKQHKKIKDKVKLTRLFTDGRNRYVRSSKQKKEEIDKSTQPEPLKFGAKLETEARKEKRLAKAYLTRTINLFKKSTIQNEYTAETIKDLEYFMDYLDYYYPFIREFQKNKNVKKKEYYNQIKGQLKDYAPNKINTLTDYKESKELQSKVKKIIYSWNYETIQIVKHSDDRLLMDIETWYKAKRKNSKRPDLDPYVDEWEDEFLNLMKAFVDKYGEINEKGRFTGKRIVPKKS